MRRRRRHAGGFDTNLDSLQDTITNVIGFLVLVLAVVGVNIGDTAPPPPQTSGELEQQSRDIRAKAEELRARLLGLLNDITAQKADIASLEAGRNTTDELDQRMSDLLAELERSRSEISANTATVQSLEEKIRGLEHDAESKPARQTEEIPDIRVEERWDPGSNEPRPDWMDKKVLVFACRQGMVVVPALDDSLLDQALLGGIRRATGMDPAKVKGLESWQKVRSYFDSNNIGNDAVNIRILFFQGTDGITLGYEYVFAEGLRGDRPADLRSSNSQLRRLLADTYSPTRRWVRFSVWDDSFEAYREARLLAASLGYQVGWLPYARDERLRYGGGGGSAPHPHIGPG